MPSPASESGSTRPAPRSAQKAAGRVVPAIPLALTRPSQAKKAAEPAAPAQEEQRQVEAEKETQLAVTNGEHAPVEPTQADVREERLPNDADQDKQKDEGEELEPSLPETPAQATAAVVDSPGDGAVKEPDIATTQEEPDCAEVSDVGKNPKEAVKPVEMPSLSAESIHATEFQPATAPAHEVSQPKAMHPPRRAGASFELPPAFYPAERISTPPSATSSIFPHPPPTAPAAMHHPRPSGNVVFGGYPDSSSSSPAPPASAGAGQFPHMPPPEFVPSQYGVPQFAPPGHTHHPSDPSLAVMYPPTAFGYPYPPHPQPYGRPYPYQYPQRALAANGNDGLHSSVNGDGRSSRASSARSSNFQQMEHIPPAGPVNARHSSHLSTNMVSVQPVQPDADVALALRDHLISQVGVPDFADCILEISSANKPVDVLLKLPIHGVVATRSPALLTQLAAPAKPCEDENGKKILWLYASSTSWDGRAFTDALKYLYGAPLPEMSYFLYGLEPFDPNTARDMLGSSLPRRRMSRAIAYAISGDLLQLPMVTARGLESVKAALRWDTIESVMAIASDRSPFGQQILQMGVEFLVRNFPEDFTLNTDAPQLDGSPCFPFTTGAKPSLSNPRLSQIRFGEVPLEQPEEPGYITTKLSAILISAPTEVLQMLFTHPELSDRVEMSKVSQWQRSVVFEREARRSKILKSHTRSSSRGIASNDDVLRLLSTEERLEPSPQSASGFQIVQRGVETAPTHTNGTTAT